MISVITSVDELDEIVQAMKRNQNNEYMTDAVEITVDRDEDGLVIVITQQHLNDSRCDEVFEVR
mgnify:CR=1 FL=1